ncbi:sensor histidine kinase [Methanobacterium alcaliphilum]|uniref:sensor histidine kinase n=1 Tax=Methanobacterium alcaliphilum TaxID=392018 RepID=UPI00200B0B2C|nr:PAS domain S-box protein [Methanobacterium alcaliphilum]MCK9150687.1 PAS domain S-box protein [Methanobacterium alcaliphilum]
MVIYIIILITLINNDSIRSNFSNSILPLANVAVLVLIYFAAIKSKEYNKSAKKAWWLLFTSQIVLFVLDFLWAVWNIGFGISLDFITTIILFMTHVIFLSAALVAFPHPQIPKLQQMRRIADIGIVMCILFIALWTLIVDRIVRFGMTDIITVVCTVIFVLIEFALCYSIIGVFLRNAGQIKNRPISFLLISATLQAVSTAIFAYFIVQGNYTAGGIPDILMLSSYMFIGAAAVLQITQNQPKIIHDCSNKAWYMNLSFNHHIPLFFGILAYIMLLLIYLYNQRIFLSMLMAAGAAIGLVVMRQFLQMEEIKRAHHTAEKNRLIAEENEMKFKAIIENSIDAIVITNENNKIAQWNTGAERIYGYTAEEAINQDIEFIIPPQLVQFYKNELSQKISDESFKNQIHETLGLRKDGKEIPLEESVTQWQGKSGPVFAAIIRDVSERKTSEEALKKSLDEKNILLMEIHHRVKNHLQIISSLITLLSFTIDDDKTKNTLLEIQNRIQTIALIHELLYQSKNLSKVNMKHYIENIIKNLTLTYKNIGQKIDLSLDIEDVYLNMETATPCGLIINEIVTNSFKYAFPRGRAGKISITFKKLPDDYLLTLSDNGVGLAKEISFENKKTLGLRLINNLVKQVGGEIELDRSQGTKFKIIFKEADYGKRV